VQEPLDPEALAGAPERVSNVVADDRSARSRKQDEREGELPPAASAAAAITVASLGTSGKTASSAATARISG
jgi:hypothetical protein